MSFWPLVVCAIVLAIVRGDWVPALLFGVIADALFGSPTNRIMHAVAVPFTLGTLFAVVLWMLLSRQMRSDMPDVL